MITLLDLIQEISVHILDSLRYQQMLFGTSFFSIFSRDGAIPFSIGKQFGRQMPNLRGLFYFILFYFLVVTTGRRFLLQIISY